MATSEHQAGKTEYVVYLGPSGAEVDLEPMKIYRLAPAEANDPKDYLRVIDESGEDYLYPQRLFERIILPKRVEAALKVEA